MTTTIGEATVTTELAVPTRIPTPTAIGQATAVEQARAEAEVKAAVVVAQQCPRDTAEARRQMIESCNELALASRAFFSYRRGTSQVTGPGIHLARELARTWGNVQYGIAEMRRDDVAGESEMMAFAWDVQTNTRSSTTFIVPHRRDTQKGPVPLVDVRDVYENNANMGARRVREMIFAILPPWFTEQAKEICNATIQRGDGTPLPERIANMVTAYAGLGVGKRQLEDKIGVRSENWTARDVAALTVVWRSLSQRETTLGEEFPAAQPVTDGQQGGGLAAALAPQTSGAEEAPAPGQAVEPETPSAPESASSTSRSSGAEEAPGRGFPVGSDA